MPHPNAQTTPAVRVQFGSSIRKTIADEVRRLGASQALVLSTPEQNDAAFEMAELLGPLAAGVFCKAEMHTPVRVTEAAMAHVNETKADCVVAIGGGSTIGLGKAIAYRSDLPQITIPTTYAGSEATPILGQTENGEKTTLSHPSVLPEVILYDPELVTSLPLPMTVTSALNAMAHAAEALYATNRTGETTAMAIDGLRAFSEELPEVLVNPTDLAAREATQRGAWACGTVLGQVGMSLHHKLCHTLGGSFDLPHAQTHAIILPHAIAYNARSARDELQPICDLLGGENAGLALHAFAQKLNAPLALKELGLKESDLNRAAELATTKPYPNPHPVTRSDIRLLLQAAWSGDQPIP
ncbi:maleylacetate reductase [Amylibacter sp. IMCC11727]|uniref:maleylacetate reductase n=1 Tax=Amylibacter sp. IMCC11727 TaxID=3039851 RepID=UPI00244E3270|nr:maleylacetate reductase [Amylibacter sp. IMCC11727]WGI23296.1 maleylacetate reductase [Amylibacter sp. IMCC11727]